MKIAHLRWLILWAIMLGACAAGWDGLGLPEFASTASSPSPGEARSAIGIIGMAVMGENLALNLESHGLRVSVYNRNMSRVSDFLGPSGRGFGKRNIVSSPSLGEFVESLSSPRLVMLVIKAGAGVDQMIDVLVPLLRAGDVIIDGGNSNFHDSNQRALLLEAQGILFVGAGISSGEEGALSGLSIMPGGSAAAWPLIRDIFTTIAARVDGQPCCDWMSDAGAGHYVKMVHNGLEYCEMQLLAEVYHILQDHLHLSATDIGDVFGNWTQRPATSYLMQLTAQIFTLKVSDPDDPLFGRHIIDTISDAAGQKGTGRWTSVSALELGSPATIVAEAVFARHLSTLQSERESASHAYPRPASRAFFPDSEASQFLNHLEHAILATRAISYAQGFQLLKAAAHRYRWDFDYAKLALIWRGGLISSDLLQKVQAAFVSDPDAINLILHGSFIQLLKECESGWRAVLTTAIQKGIPTPTMSAAMAYFDGYRTARLPGNLLQAQRDFFGAHQYERVDQPGTWMHTDWSGGRCYRS